MMAIKSQLEMVKQFHQKFRVPVASTPTIIAPDRYDLRHRLMAEEVEEYLAGAKENNLENIAKELADILYTVYGAILEHGLQDKMTAVFDEVHRSNMTKTFHECKIVKGSDFQPADLTEILN